MAPRPGPRDVSILAAALVVATTATTFLDWGRSGERARTSYELVDVADRAGVLPAELARIAPVWFLVPAVCGLVVIAAATRRAALAGTMTATLGSLVVAGAVLVQRSPLVTAPAVPVAAVLGGCTALSGVVVLVATWKEKAA